MDTLIGVAIGLVVSAFVPQVPTWVHNKVLGLFVKKDPPASPQ